MTRNRFLVLPLAFLLSLLLFVALPATAQSAPPQKNATATKPAKNDTVIPDDVSDTETMDANDPRFGVPPMPKGRVALIGGTVQKVDPIRQRITVRVFGSNRKMTFGYDERSHLFRDDAPATYKALAKGEHVYVDSMLDRDNHLFARNVRVVTSLKPADARGQITQYRPDTGVLIIRDELSQGPVYLHVGPDTKISGNGADSRQDLIPGSLIAVRFASNYHNGDTAREIDILAMPGASFTFAGPVTHLDLKDGVLAVHNQSDDKTYELRFDPGVVNDDVIVGTSVVVSAEFAGTHYKARTVKVMQPPNSQSSTM
ncbi:MAG: hypothetical protein ACRD3E_03855 [Terriglobales bacterium]